MSVFSVAAGGALTQVWAPVHGGPSPHSVAFSPSGELLATANWDDGSVSVFSVSAGGALTPVAGTGLARLRPAAGRNAASVAFSPSGGLLATANGR